MSLLEMSFSGAVLIIAIALLRVLLIRTSFPKEAFRCLWAVAAVRLLVPWKVSSVLSIYTWLSSHAAAKPLSRLSERLVSGGVAVGAPLSEAAGASPTLSWLTLVWLLGALVLAGIFLASYLHCQRIFRVSFPVNRPDAETWLQAHHLCRIIQLRGSDRIAAPLTYGVFRPVILLPMDMAEKWEEGLDCVLAHEYVHICRFDTVFKLLLAAALCLHWWNPAVWMLYVLANRDIELSCDQLVLERLGISRRAYARALLSLEAARSGLPGLFSQFGGYFTERRIRFIIKHRKVKPFVVFFAVLLVVAITGAFATSAKSESAVPADEALIEKMVDTITYSGNQITFSIPEEIANPEELVILIYGRAVYSDGFSRSLHFLEEEAGCWQAGNVYAIPYDDTYTELVMDIFWKDTTGRQLERSVDLLAFLS